MFTTPGMQSELPKASNKKAVATKSRPHKKNWYENVPHTNFIRISDEQLEKLSTYLQVLQEEYENSEK